MRDRPLWITALAVAVVGLGIVGRATAPALDSVDADPFRTPAADVARWHASGHPVRCRLSPGRWDPRLPDAARFPPGVLGPTYPDGSRDIDLRQWNVVAPVLADRLDLCAGKGFDGVVIDRSDSDLAPVWPRFVAMAGSAGLTVTVTHGGAGGGAGSADTSTTTGS